MLIRIARPGSSPAARRWESWDQSDGREPAQQLHKGFVRIAEGPRGEG
jgi:hypothetical protein